MSHLFVSRFDNRGVLSIWCQTIFGLDFEIRDFLVVRDYTNNDSRYLEVVWYSGCFPQSLLSKISKLLFGNCITILL